MRKIRERHRDFNGFNDPLAKVLLGIGIVLTVLLHSAVILVSLVGPEFLALLKLVTGLLGAFAIFGAICGLVGSMRWRSGAAARRAVAKP